MSRVAGRTQDWAEDEEDDALTLPGPEVVKNANGTETHITYRWRDDGKKVKTTRIIKKNVMKHKVNPQVAERRTWAKFGASAKDPAGPQSDTTTVGENIELNPRQGFRGIEREDQSGSMAEIDKQKEKLKAVATVKCRICNGEHFTARCPFKGTMAPEGEPTLGEPAADPMADAAPGGATKGGAYVPPAIRNRGAAMSGERMGGKYERDDLATLRVTNVSEYAEESELRDMFERWGRVTRVFLAKDRDTQRAKGFAFVSFADRADAAKACQKMDGFGYNNLILRVEFAKKST